MISYILCAVFVLVFFLPTLFFQRKSKMTKIAGRLKVATLGKTNNIQSAFFYYEPIRSQELINDSLFQSALKDAAALSSIPLSSALWLKRSTGSFCKKSPEKYR